jgi:hypothetical protein
VALDQADEWHRAMHSAAAALLGRAQESGDVRVDVDVNDLLWLANGIALGGADDTRARRLLHIVRTGSGPLS